MSDSGRNRFHDTVELVAEKAVALGHKALRRAGELKESLLGQEITVYPTYAYRDPVSDAGWIVPIRVWVHDNRDTPFVEATAARLAVGYFARDLQRALLPREKERLLACLAPFIADDKNNESVELVLKSDRHEERFRLHSRTSPNGIIEEDIRIPDELLREARVENGPNGRWLTIHARTGDGNGSGSGRIRLLQPEGLSVISDIDDTMKITGVSAGPRAVLRSTFLEEFRAAPGMRDRYLAFLDEAAAVDATSFHYVSGSPWQLFGELQTFLIDQERFPEGTFHMKNLRKNIMEAGAIESIRAFAIGGDLATLDQKIRQITQLVARLPRRQFILVGDSGEKDPELYRAVQRIFPQQIRRIIIRDVLGERLNGMERIAGPEVALSLDTAEIEAEMITLVQQTRVEAT